MSCQTHQNQKPGPMTKHGMVHCKKAPAWESFSPRYVCEKFVAIVEGKSK